MFSPYYVKPLKRLFITQLESHLVKKNLLYEFQPGFRSNHSKDTCLTYLTDYIKTKTSKGLYTGMIMSDGPDTVDHVIFGKTLKAMAVNRLIGLCHIFRTGVRLFMLTSSEVI